METEKEKYLEQSKSYKGKRQTKGKKMKQQPIGATKTRRCQKNECVHSSTLTEHD